MTDAGLYVRRLFNVPAELNTRVEVGGWPGVITGFEGGDLLVTFQGERQAEKCHPLFRVQYFAELLPPAVPTQSGPVD